MLTAILDVFFITKELYGDEDDDQWNDKHLTAIALLIYTALISCCVGCLAGYHGKLACEGITTNEEIRGKFGAGRGNPYDLGCAGNCAAFWYGGTSRVYTDEIYDV